MNSLLKVGAAKADITPSKKILPIPLIFTIKFEGVHDNLHVRILDIENENERVLFATFDTPIIPNAPDMIKYLCELSGLDETHVFACATHNHCAPYVGIIDEKTDKKVVAWYEDVKKAVKEAVEKAAKVKRPAKIGFGTSKSYINVNRDAEPVNGKSILGFNFERPSDKTLSLVKFIDEKDKPIAFIVNYAVHGTLMNGNLVDGKIKICGDLPGKASTLIEDRYKNSVCLWTSGAAGDQNPRVMTQFTSEKGGFGGVKSLGETGYLFLDSLGKEHERDILKAESSIESYKNNISLKVQKTNVSCEGRIPDNMLALAKLKKIDVNQPPAMDYILRLVTIGDLAIEGISAEVVTSIGAAVKAVSTLKNTILITQTDIYKGYVPDDWEYENHAFEAEGTSVKQGAAQPAFENGFRKLFSSI